MAESRIIDERVISAFAGHEPMVVALGELLRRGLAKSFDLAGETFFAVMVDNDMKLFQFVSDGLRRIR